MSAAPPEKEQQQDVFGEHETPTRAPAKIVPNGAAVAACLAALIGLLTLAIVVFACEASPAFSRQVHAIGKAWMPGAEGIGPYSGKQTLMLIAWLVSWPVLHFWLRQKELRGAFWLTIFLVGIGVATTLIWPPVWGLLLGAH